MFLAVLALGAGLQAWVAREQRSLRTSPRGEGCLACHAAVQGLEASHAGSCASCHLGDRQAEGAEAAHAGMVRLPGQLADAARTCGQAACHPTLPARLEANIMTTMNGVVSVDRWVFGEQPTPTAHTPVATLGSSPADTHLRGLCASCHLGAPRAEAGPLDELSRGGGCLACHLRYSAAATASLGGWRQGAQRPFVHPALSARPEPIACFGCHSRSGRVSLNFSGWQEFEGDAGGAPVRMLTDGRALRQGLPDVHAERGLGCVDCHGSWEVMGTGAYALHREQQSTVRCTDCHRLTAPATVGLESMDPESLKVATLEGLARAGRRYLLLEQGRAPLVNAFVDDAGLALEAKYTGARLALRPPAAACTRGPAHRALACQGCHDAWAPQCVSCHTAYQPDGGGYDLLAGTEVAGEWVETGGAPLADRPSLGVRMLDGGARRIEEFAPGMVMTLALGPGQPPRFSRRFAPVFPHTIRREARSCVQCHLEPLALGYGRGVLALEAGRWRFTPRWPPRPEDGLPGDAWVGFLAERGPESTTREDTRPFTLEEQRRILTVGACLGCHAGDSRTMQRGLEDFAAVLLARSPRCRSPSWR
jgi:hypothetical protein